MRKLLIGVTGNIGSGKSLVARLLAERGCALVDADRAAHDLYRERPELVERLAMTFGAEVLGPDGGLNRARLGEMVFGDARSLEKLNAIVHPALRDYVRARIDDWFRRVDCVVLDAALIVELGLAGQVDYLVAVTAPEEIRRERLMRRNGLSGEEAEKRMRSQKPEEEKAALANFRLENDGPFEALRDKVVALWKEILARERAQASRPSPG